MKKCPTCQKTFDDDKRFCQIDGTPLVADTVENSDANDPYKTVFGGQAFDPTPKPSDDFPKATDAKREDEDVLQIPEAFDPMKTMVVSDIKNDIPKNEPPVKQPEPPKFNEPSLSPPNFDSPFPPLPEKPKFDSPFDKSADFQKSPASPFDEPPKFGSPFSPTEQEPPKFDSPFEKKEEPIYDKPKDNPFPPFKDSTAPLGEKKDPFQNSAFGLPQTPLEKSYNPPPSSFDPPPMQNTDWNPPPAPNDNWANQEIGSNTPFNPPPAGTTGQNQTLAIVSLVCGVLGLCCGPFGIAALITGYLAKKNADSNPAEYTGGGFALAGMILGGISVVLFIVGILLNLLGVFASFGR